MQKDLREQLDGHGGRSWQKAGSNAGDLGHLAPLQRAIESLLSRLILGEISRSVDITGSFVVPISELYVPLVTIPQRTYSKLAGWRARDVGVGSDSFGFLSLSTEPPSQLVN